MRVNKHLAFVFLFMLSLRPVIAQDKRFIYIQSDQQQPFYVRIGNLIYSSTDAGYVIIPDVSQGVCKFTVGFPKNTWGTLNYAVDIGQNDKGFRLHKVDSVSWVLYDYQTSTYLNAKSEFTEDSSATSEAKDDFTNILEEVSSASLAQKKNADNKTAVNQTTDTSIVKTTVPQTESSSPSDSLSGTAEKNNTARISKTMDWVTDSGRVMRYSITDGKDSEMVMVMIPKQSAAKESVIFEKQASIDSLTKEKMSREAKYSTLKVKDAPKNESNSVIKDTDKRLCNVVAEEKDFLELRRNMVKEDTEAGMLVVCENAFTAACYSKAQIRNLAVLFINEDKRLAFLKRAYLYCNDTNQYETLLELLSDKEKADELRAFIR